MEATNITLEHYKDFIDANITLQENTKLLLAVSGGIDSMVLLHLALSCGHNIAVAHVNHHLRGIASDADASLVQKICNYHNINYHQLDLKPDSIGLSNFQEKARILRYDWFQELAMTHDYSYICTAHHASDSIETFFINLVRGTGIDGLTGIPSHIKNIVRPLHKISKEQIIEYAISEEIAYREDVSNHSNKYLRNKIRNTWLPTIYNDIVKAPVTIQKTINHLKEEQELANELCNIFIKPTLSFNEMSYQIIDLTMLSSLVHINTLLYKAFKKFGFNRDQVDQLMNADTGAIFYSSSFELLKDRSKIVLRRKIKEKSTLPITVDKIGTYKISRNISLQVIDKETSLGLFLPKVTLPISIRYWQAGDQFAPLGMKGKRKKVKDFLTDLKLDRWTKEQTLVIVKDNVIVGVLPYRASESQHIEKNTLGGITVSIDYLSLDDKTLM